MSSPDALIGALSRIDTPTLSNAIERLKVRSPVNGFADRNLRCIFPDLGVLCGFAVTAEVETMNPDEPGRLDQAFFDLCRAIEQSPKPAVVVLQESGPSSEFCAHCGEVLATTFKRLGAAGLVSDSGVRDLPEVHAMKFQYFAPGAVASHGNFRFVRAQVPVTVCGLAISPGDLLHGDSNGLIKVPAQGREKLPDAAKAVTEAEKKVMGFIRGESFTLDGLIKMITH